ncbi:hypothetical protein SAMN06272789_3382 [Streptomyces sp. 1331.2]|nr:hypothetical protein SAMN06272789_3382 [Streptomyces sp. 1331.2]
MQRAHRRDPMGPLTLCAPPPRRLITRPSCRQPRGPAARASSTAGPPPHHPVPRRPGASSPGRRAVSPAGPLPGPHRPRVRHPTTRCPAGCVSRRHGGSGDSIGQEAGSSDRLYAARRRPAGAGRRLDQNAVLYAA